MGEWSHTVLSLWIELAETGDLIMVVSQVTVSIILPFVIKSIGHLKFSCHSCGQGD
jgi:hypothetical protein